MAMAQGRLPQPEGSSAVQDSQTHRQLAARYLATNDLPRARQHGERALDYARQTGDRLEEGIVHRVMGQIAIEQAQQRDAAEYLAQSKAILQELGCARELALTLVEEAWLLEGDTQIETLERAREILARLGAPEAEGVKRLLEDYTSE
jgi:tetratricopeptide (TPR) repeat protein